MPDAAPGGGADRLSGRSAVRNRQAEAWRRAETWLTHGGRRPVAVAVAEFTEGSIARPVPCAPDAHERLVVVDRRTGGITLWPSLPEDVLAEQYRRYELGLRLGLDTGADPD